MDPQRPPEAGLNWPRPGLESSPHAPTWQGQSAHPQDSGRNGFSIAALVLGIIPITGGLLAIIFGLIGRSQAKQRGQKGRVMGTWGAALGTVWLIVIIGIVANDVSDDVKRDDAGQVVEPGEETSSALRIGDCLRTLPKDAALVDDVDLITCARAHRGEVYASIPLTYSSYPGEKTATSRAEKLCIAAFEPFVGKGYNDSTLDVYYIYPTARSWRLGDHNISCLISGTHLVGTTKGSHR